MTKKVPITVAYGDGIGPEIMEATLAILDAAQAQIQPETIEIGEKVYKRGILSGIEDSSWESLHRTKVFLKSPITTPQGGGFKSLNVTVRKSLALFANIRPCISYAPYVKTTQPKMDMVIVRENEEDLYAGIEHQQTDNVVQCLKLISQTGCERINRYAFEYARTNGRKKITCISKDNIMKMTDGLFHKVFDQVAKDYPEIETNHMIVDIGAAKIAAKPELFDVIVTENLYGDILSDIAAEVAGSVGLCGSSNIGKKGAMFEAIHGSAPDITGKGIANPSGLLHAALMMLQHIGQADIAEKIHNAWLRTLEDGVHTGDIYSEQHSKRKVGTKEFSEAVVERMGSKPERFKPVTYGSAKQAVPKMHDIAFPKPADKKLVGIDVFVHWEESLEPNILANRMIMIRPPNMKLSSIDSRGLLVWPEATTLQEKSDHWRCRFVANGDTPITHENIISLLADMHKAGFDFIKTENLYSFNGTTAFTVAQGQ